MKKIIAILILIAVLSACTVEETAEKQKEFTPPPATTQPKGDFVELEFVHEDCGFDGEFTFNNQSLGTFKTSFKFTLDDFNSFKTSNSGFCVNGNLKNCDYEGWFIDTNCWDYTGDETYFTGDSFELQITFNPRSPVRHAMSNFVRPDDVRWYTDKMNMDDGTERDIDRIHGRMSSKSYILDSVSSDKSDFWRFPNETLGIKQVDCEDWSTTFLSLVKAYNKNLKCYNMLAPGHITTLCKIENEYVLYDQKETKISTIVNPAKSWNDKRLKMRNWLNDYFETYGFKSKYRTIYAAFDEDEYLEFEEINDFIQWALDL